MRRCAPIRLPAIARLEIACVLARRLRDAHLGRELADQLLQSPLIAEIAMDASLLAGALTKGTESFLRAGDALYAALIKNGGGILISWDNELIRRVEAITPETWLVDYGLEEEGRTQ